jgi:choline dehydrogenase-like flavoprotein
MPTHVSANTNANVIAIAERAAALIAAVGLHGPEGAGGKIPRWPGR